MYSIGTERTEAPKRGKVPFGPHLQEYYNTNIYKKDIENTMNYYRNPAVLSTFCTFELWDVFLRNRLYIIKNGRKILRKADDFTVFLNN